MAFRPVYLDYAATTPVDPAVRDAMLPYLEQNFGNPSSIHRWGQEVRRGVDRARDQVAASIGAQPGEVYFTSGGTEADNTALLGVLLARREEGRDQLVTTTIEHHAILDTARFAEKALGFRVTYLPTDSLGRVAPESVEDAVSERTALVSIMHANNEIGTLESVEQFARIAHARGAYFHTDAVQTYAHYPLDREALGADLVTLSAHKIYGPKGVGALVARKGIRFTPWLYGGQQEREKRAGTENAPGIIGFGKAAELLPSWRDGEAARLTRLRQGFLDTLRSELPDLQLNGHPEARLPNNLNISFPGTDGETLLLALDLHGIAASSGSACASGSIEPSHVLLALGLPLALARAAVRFSLGRQTTEEELAYAAGVVIDVVRAAKI